MSSCSLRGGGWEEELNRVLQLIEQKTHKSKHHPTTSKWGYKAVLEMVGGFNQELKSTDKSLVMRVGLRLSWEVNSLFLVRTGSSDGYLVLWLLSRPKLMMQVWGQAEVRPDQQDPWPSRGTAVVEQETSIPIVEVKGCRMNWNWGSEPMACNMT